MPEALVQGGGGVVRADHDADRGPVEVEVANGSLVPAARDAKGGARRAILAGQPELPAGHPLSADPPLVRPREDACAGDPSLDRRLELPLQNVRLSLLAVRLLTRGNTDLPEHERPVTGQMLQLAEIAAEVLAALEKDVEHQEVDALQRQVLGGRIIGVGDQPAGVDLADDLDQLVERVRHGLQPVPAQDIGGNLVTQREPQDSRVPGQALRGGQHLLAGLARNLPSLAPRAAQEVAPVGIEHPREDPEADLGRRLEQVLRRHRVGADDAEPCRAHHRQVALESLAAPGRGCRQRAARRSRR